MPLYNVDVTLTMDVQRANLTVRARSTADARAKAFKEAQARVGELFSEANGTVQVGEAKKIIQKR